MLICSVLRKYFIETFCVYGLVQTLQTCFYARLTASAAIYISLSLDRLLTIIKTRRTFTGVTSSPSSLRVEPDSKERTVGTMSKRKRRRTTGPVRTIQRKDQEDVMTRSISDTVRVDRPTAEPHIPAWPRQFEETLQVPFSDPTGFASSPVRRWHVRPADWGRFTRIRSLGLARQKPAKGRDRASRRRTDLLQSLAQGCIFRAEY